MSFKIPTDRTAPLPPPPESQGPGKKKDVSGKEPATTRSGEKTSATDRPPVTDAAIRYLETQSLATKLAILARHSAQENASFETILSQVMRETNIYNPQAAMEEADRRLKEEIDDLLTKIKENKDLMTEAENWQQFADLLESELTSDQLKRLEELLKEQLKSISA